MSNFSEPIICGLVGLIMLVTGYTFLAGASIGISAFAAFLMAAQPNENIDD